MAYGRQCGSTPRQQNLTATDESNPARDGLVVSRTAAGTRVAESAALLPRTVITHIRALAADAADTGTNIEDVVSVLRSVWGAAEPGVSD